MPFKSKAQQRFMFSQHPEIAERWAKKTDFSTLPEKAYQGGGFLSNVGSWFQQQGQDIKGAYQNAQNSMTAQQVGNAGGIAGLAGGAIDMFSDTNEYGVKSDGAAVLGGVGKGVAAGASFGPVGMGVGALVGGITSLIGNNKAKAAEREAKRKENAAINRKNRLDSENVLASYDNQGTGITEFKTGGAMKYPFPYQNQLKQPGWLTPDPNMFQNGGVANTNFDINLTKILGPSSPQAYWKGLAKTTEGIGNQAFTKQFVNGGYMGSVLGHSNPAPGVAVYLKDC